MLIKLDITQQKNAMEMLDGIAPKTIRGIEKAFWRVGRDLRDQVNRQTLKLPKTGIVYIRRDSLGRRRRHRSSAMGESHANMTGALRKSVGWKASGMQLRFGYGATQNDAPNYAKKVEFKLNRPTLQNSINEEIRNVEQHLAHFVFKEFR